MIQLLLNLIINGKQLQLKNSNVCSNDRTNGTQETSGRSFEEFDIWCNMADSIVGSPATWWV